jgi:hypothetical protein
MESVGMEWKDGEVTQLRGLRISKRWIIEKVKHNGTDNAGRVLHGYG